MQNKPDRVVVLGTGGTIAGTASRADDHTGYTAAQLGVADLLAPLGDGAAAGPVESEQVLQLDSKDMHHAGWQQLARRVAHHLARAEVAGVVITHGTDTLEETAYFLQRVLAPTKPVVMTAAMRPATALQTDGPQNLRDALVVARWPGACGVVAVVAGRVIGATDLRKVHTYRLDAFDAGDAGPLGQVEEGRLRLWRAWPAGSSAGTAALLTHTAQWPWVEVVTSHAGADARLVDALLTQGVQGLVIAATGNGTVHEALAPALQRAMDAGVRVVRATRCASGALVGADAEGLLRHTEALGQGGGPAPLAGAGALTPVQARIELLLTLLPRT